MSIKVQEQDTVTQTRLWQRMAVEPSLQQALADLRRIAAAMGAEVARVIPGFTDHSVKHFDALWRVSNQVLTAEEVEKCSPGEAFILGSSFYVHDLGMAFAATQEGTDIIRSSPDFASTLELLSNTTNIDASQAEALALQLATRQLHASKARDLVLQPLPGLNRYLIESTDLRNRWGTYIGDVSASHHWSIPELENKLGKNGKMPDPIGGSTDLGFVACALRIIDYAHINFERASYLSRLLRSQVDSQSLLHWLAQEHITGPLRKEDLLVFGSNQPIRDVDAWWLFFEMAEGLDREIHLVADYLASRPDSIGRFSLEGVKGVRSPQLFANLVKTEGFEPVDIRFRPDSIERLVNILGGKTLYGDDVFAPIRELLQNGRDAIALQRTIDHMHGRGTFAGHLSLAVERPDQNKMNLIVTDNGVGMTSNVITDYLLGIASDYWNSSAFYSDYPGVNAAGFRPTGKFGIGFLSVFMVGDKVEVETQRRHGANLKLRLTGVGRRGALVTNPPKVSSGTTISIEVKKENQHLYEQIDAIVRARAPMLDVPVTVNQLTRSFIVEPGWWKSAPQDEFYDFVAQWQFTAFNRSKPTAEYRHYGSGLRRMSLSKFLASEKWVDRQPEVVTETSRIMALPQHSLVLLCTRGIAVTTVHIEGIVGMIDSEGLELVAARSEIVQFDRAALEQKLVAQITPKIIESLNQFSKEGSIPSRFGFIANVAKSYGISVVLRSSLPWLTVVDELGNASLINASQLKEKISAAPEVLVSYGAGPWEVFRVTKRRFPVASRNAVLIPIPTDNQGRPGSWDDRDEFTRAELRDHFADYRGVPVLITAVLDVISTSWEIPRRVLEASEWVRHKTENVSAHFVRKKLTSD